MGIYFIAAGTSSKNRQKTLEKSFTLEQLQSLNCIPEEYADRLVREFQNGNE